MKWLCVQSGGSDANFKADEAADGDRKRREVAVGGFW